MELTSPQMFSGGYTGDIRTTLLYVSSLYPDAPLLGVGFSLGANVLARYVGEEGEDCRLTSACVMACPWDNVKNSELLSEPSRPQSVLVSGSLMIKLHVSIDSGWRPGG